MKVNLGWGTNSSLDTQYNALNASHSIFTETHLDFLAPKITFSCLLKLPFSRIRQEPNKMNP